MAGYNDKQAQNLIRSDQLLRWAAVSCSQRKAVCLKSPARKGVLPDLSSCTGVQVRALLQDRHEIMSEGLDCLHAFFAQDGPEVLAEWDRYLHQVNLNTCWNNACTVSYFCNLHGLASTLR